MSLLSGIISYLEFLKKEYNLSISIHHKGGALAEYMHKIAPYNIHRNSYCLFVKNNREVWDKCISRQYKVFEHCGEELFFGVCYAGVGEFVMPIRADHTLIGFISVSGYRAGPEAAERKLRYFSKEYAMDYEALRRVYETQMAPAPDMEWIRTLITPLRSMLELLCIQNEIPYKNLQSDTGDYVYGHILAYLNLNYGSKITLEDISKACHCSVSYISHVFKKRSGKSVSGYVSEIRVREASRLLRETGLSVKEIAYMVGFSDSNYFTNVFKKKYQTPPKVYRKLWGEQEAQGFPEEKN